MTKRGSKVNIYIKIYKKITLKKPLWKTSGKKKIARWNLTIFVVPLAGLEPARMLLRGILSPLRLPIPPQRRKNEQINFFEKTLRV